MVKHPAANLTYRSCMETLVAVWVRGALKELYVLTNNNICDVWLESIIHLYLYIVNFNCVFMKIYEL